MKGIPTHFVGKIEDIGNTIQHIAQHVTDLILASVHFSTPDYLAPGEV
jgi:hypothetical protein